MAAKLYISGKASDHASAVKMAYDRMGFKKGARPAGTDDLEVDDITPSSGGNKGVQRFRFENGQLRAVDGDA